MARSTEFSTAFDPYGGASNSEWNGMPLVDWGNTMLAAGYSSFSTDSGQNRASTCLEALPSRPGRLFRPLPADSKPHFGNYPGHVNWSDGTKSPLNIQLDERCPYILPGQYLGEYRGNNFRREDENGNVFTGRAAGDRQVSGVVEAQKGEWQTVGSFSASRK